MGPGGSIAFSFGTASGTISETQTTLANGADDFILTIAASSGNIFPGATGGYVGWGDRSAIQFTSPFDLTAAILTYSDPSGPYASANVIGDVSQPDPFNGAFPSAGNLLGFSVASDTTMITLQLEGPPPPVPEPSSLVLLGTGLAGVVGAMRRRLTA